MRLTQRSAVTGYCNRTILLSRLVWAPSEHCWRRARIHRTADGRDRVLRPGPCASRREDPGTRRDARRNGHRASRKRVRLVEEHAPEGCHGCLLRVGPRLQARERRRPIPSSPFSVCRTISRS